MPSYRKSNQLSFFLILLLTCFTFSMEIQFQQQKKSGNPAKKASKFKGRKAPNNNNKFVGVRQRPSGRWVAEIKDSTQKIRMWLGTFETAEEAAKAYDQAACLLRGSNTRTNFITQVSLNSPIASRIQNLLKNKKTGKKQQPKEETAEVSNSTLTTNTSSCSSSGRSYSFICDNNTPNEIFNDTQFFDDVYKSDMTTCIEAFKFDSSQSDFSGHTYDRFSFTQEVLGFPRNMSLPEASDLEYTEFDRMKVERQISVSLYAINGLQENMETVHDPIEALWDLPPINLI